MSTDDKDRAAVEAGRAAYHDCGGNHDAALEAAILAAIEAARGASRPPLCWTCRRLHPMDLTWMCSRCGETLAATDDETDAALKARKRGPR